MKENIIPNLLRAPLSAAVTSLNNALDGIFDRGLLLMKENSPTTKTLYTDVEESDGLIDDQRGGFKETLRGVFAPASCNMYAFSGPEIFLDTPRSKAYEQHRDNIFASLSAWVEYDIGRY
ncbi:hypothetical protein E4U30_004054 [Claviceps sp. LM220 group G6]|nr:hypothetical protein E4U30_004054 [Claviceps sp. LM220 group G6]KAG6116307.1 hypothetical protein E4U14_000310 [Claviceps sp. LM454 group G7]